MKKVIILFSLLLLAISCNKNLSIGSTTETEPTIPTHDVNDAVSTLEITVPGLGVGGKAIESVIVRGAWKDYREYSVTFETPIEGSFTDKVVAYIVVPPTDNDFTFDKVYVEVHATNNDNSKCYECTPLFSKIEAGNIYQIVATIDTKEVSFPYDGEYNGHRYVTVGGVKWSTCAVGAFFPWEHGDRFRWGALTPDSDNWDKGMSELVPDFNDAATYTWRLNWRIPRKEQIDNSLLRGNLGNVTEESYTLAGVPGKRYKESDKKWFFVPNSAVYWTATPYYDTHDYMYSTNEWAYAYQAGYGYAYRSRDDTIEVRPVVSTL